LGVGRKADDLALKKISAVKSKEVQTGSNLAKSSKKKLMAQKVMFFP
jgi:hypothetical protein